MQWDETKALSVVNLQDLEDRIATADQNVITGKQNIYNAIVAKGELPASQSFTDLVNAILDIILGSGNAVVGDVLATKTFTNDGGVQLTGTMANYNGATLASHDASYIDSVVVTAGNATVTFLSKFSGKIDTATKIAIVLEGLDASVIKAGVKIGDAGDTTGNDYITGTFTSDANATAGVILTGYTGYVNGVKITGTVTVRNGDNVALSSSVVGTTLKLVPPAGYYDGNDTVTLTDADNIPSNVRKNVNLNGVVGTLVEGPKADDLYSAFIEVDGIDNDFVYITDRGDMTPNLKKYNHAGTLISGIKVAGLNSQWNKGSCFAGGAVWVYPGAGQLNTYNLAGTLLNAVTGLSLRSHASCGAGFDGSRMIYMNASATPYIMLMTMAKTLIAQYLCVINTWVNYQFMINFKNSMVSKNSLGGAYGSPNYYKHVIAKNGYSTIDTDTAGEQSVITFLRNWVI